MRGGGREGEEGTVDSPRFAQDVQWAAGRERKAIKDCIVSINMVSRQCAQEMLRSTGQWWEGAPGGIGAGLARLAAATATGLARLAAATAPGAVQAGCCNCDWAGQAGCCRPLASARL